MSLLTQIIPPQNYEIIRDRLAIILNDEIQNQVVLSSDNDINSKVFLERFIPIDKSEFPALNVYLSRGNYDNHTVDCSDGTYTYFVDVHTLAKSTPTSRGDTKSSLLLHKIMGICRAIIENPKYQTLGFERPSVSHVSVASIQVQEPQNNQDSTNSINGRVTITVRSIEKTQIDPKNNIDSFTSQIKINLSEKGYLYQK